MKKRVRLLARMCVCVCASDCANVSEWDRKWWKTDEKCLCINNARTMHNILFHTHTHLHTIQTYRILYAMLRNIIIIIMPIKNSKERFPSSLTLVFFSEPEPNLSLAMFMLFLFCICFFFFQLLQLGWMCLQLLCYFLLLDFYCVRFVHSFRSDWVTDWWYCCGGAYAAHYYNFLFRFILYNIQSNECTGKKDDGCAWVCVCVCVLLFIFRFASFCFCNEL